MGEMGLSIDNIMSKEDVDSLFTEDGQESEEPVDETGDEGKVVETNNNGDNRKTDEKAAEVNVEELFDDNDNDSDSPSKKPESVGSGDNQEDGGTIS